MSCKPNCQVTPLQNIHVSYPEIRTVKFCIKKKKIDELSLFQRMTVKSFLKLSKSAATPAVHFLLSELPVEGKIHRDMFSLFYQIWFNKDTKILQLLMETY